LQEQVEHLREQVQLFHERTAHVEKVDMLKKKRIWVEYSEARDVFQEKKAMLDKVIRDLKEAEKSVQPARDRLVEKEEAFKSHESQISAVSKNLAQIKKVGHTNMMKNTAIEREIKEVEHQLEGIKSSEAQRKQKIGSLKNEIVTIHDKLKSPPAANADSIDSKIRSLNLNKTSLQEELDHQDQDKRKLQQERYGIERLLHERQENLQRLDNVRSKKLAFLQKFEEDTFKALSWLNENRHLFRGHFYEPICMEIKIKHPQYASMVESCLSRQALTSFVFEDAHDYDIFLSAVADTQKLNVNVILLKQYSLNLYQPQEPLSLLKTFGFEYYFLDVIEAPEAVLCALCENFKLHLVPLSTKAVQFAQVDQRTSLRKYISAGFLYEVNRDKKTNAPAAVLSRSVKNARFFGDQEAISDAELNRIKEDILQARQNLNSLQQREALAASNETRVEEKLRSLESEMRKLVSDREQIKKQHADYAGLQRLIMRCEEELQGLLSQKTIIEQQEILKEKRLSLMQQLPVLLQENATLMSSCTEIFQKKIVLYLSLFQSQQEVQSLRSELVELEESLEQFRIDFTRGIYLFLYYLNLLYLADTAYQKAKGVAKNLLTAAKQTGGNPDTLKDAFCKLPDTIPEIDEMIERETTQSELQLNISARVLDDCSEKEHALDQLNTAIVAQEEMRQSSVDEMVLVESEWIPKIESLVQKINGRFSKFFSFMQFVGEVRLRKGKVASEESSLERDNAALKDSKDYDAWGIEILVKFRQEESLHLLDNERQSGGERSVSTILYLMALQDFSISPFRVVDEINQGT
jgi:structural maintenance of chromosomes protein 5